MKALQERFFVLLVALAFVACETIALAPEKEAGPTAPVEPAKPGAPVAGRLDPMIDVPIVTPPPDKGPSIRVRRRMDVDQLEQAFFDVTGLRWIAVRDDVEVNRFVELAATLGKPDYLQNTHEEFEPTVMFQRFLDDAARSVCLRLMELERDRPAAERVFMVHAGPTDMFAAQEAAVRRNLQMLMLKFHGVLLAADAERLEPWVRLYAGVEQDTGSPVNAWRTVCTTLITHPDFYTY